METYTSRYNGPVCFIMGPTASGKTDTAVNLAEHFPIEVINVDSSLVYRGMDIGTAKPGPDQLNTCPHHLIDIREPEETYSAAEFCSDARRLIDEITARNRIPLLVGGTMFYFHALEHGLSPLPAADPELRRELELKGAKHGWPSLHRDLERLDPQRARQINPMDRQRIQRALEIVLVSGESGVQPLPESPLHPHKIVICPSNRAILHQRVSGRFHHMLKQGLVDEVKSLMKRPGITTELPALKMVGYRQVVEFLRGEVAYNDMVERAIAATRQLAKRQLTWLRNQSGVTWMQSQWQSHLDCGQECGMDNKSENVSGRTPRETGCFGSKPSDNTILTYMRSKIGQYC